MYHIVAAVSGDLSFQLPTQQVMDFPTALHIAADQIKTWENIPSKLVGIDLTITYIDEENPEDDSEENNIVMFDYGTEKHCRWT
jgi:hypothetical protein